MPPIRKSFQLDPEQDAALIAWLTSFADRYKTGDLIKLALYQMAEIEPSVELRQLQAPQDAPAQLSLFESGAAPESGETSAAPDGAPHDGTAAQLQMIMRELVDLRAALLDRFAPQQSAPASPRIDPAQEASPPVFSGEIESGGIDMSRPRPTRTKRTTPPPHEAQEQALDPDALARELLRSIGSFGQDR